MNQKQSRERSATRGAARDGKVQASRRASAYPRMDPLVLKLLTELAPHVHEYDASSALQELSALVQKYKARKQYHEDIIAAELCFTPSTWIRSARYMYHALYHA